MAWTSGGQLPVWFGEYLLEKRVGLGGMAEVFRGARSGAFETPVAVKVLHHHLCEDAAFIELFLKEARIAAMLDHPNIVRFHEVGCFEERYFIAMEHVDGVDLSKVIASATRLGGAVPLPLSILVASHALAGLSHAHAWTGRDGRPYRIVHGDLSPSNILLSREGLATLLDFGLAQAVAGTLRGGKGLRGKFAYMSPEQVRERPVDERSDLFSMGAVLFEMITGVRLFEGATDLETLEKVDRAEVPAASSFVPGVPPIVDELLRQAMAQDPADRFASADSMRAALLSLRRHGVPMATTVDLEEVVRRVAAEEETLAEEKAARRPSRPHDVEIIPLRPSEVPEAEEPEPAALEPVATDPLAALESMLMGGAAEAREGERSEELETLDGDELEEVDEDEEAEAASSPHGPPTPPPIPRRALTPPPAPREPEPPTVARPSPAPAAAAFFDDEPEAPTDPDYDGFMDAVDALIEEQRVAEKRRASRPPRRSAPPPSGDGGRGGGA